MADKKNPAKPAAPATPASAAPSTAAKGKQLEDLLLRARQTIKPIITREATNEIVSEDLLNFRMKAPPKE